MAGMLRGLSSGDELALALRNFGEGFSPERIVLANPFKTRIIAEAEIKTDKVDARILADLLRGKLVPACISSADSRDRSKRWFVSAVLRPATHDVA